jgi:hypothetical protein
LEGRAGAMWADRFLGYEFVEIALGEIEALLLKCVVMQDFLPIF